MAFSSMSLVVFWSRFSRVEGIYPEVVVTYTIGRAYAFISVFLRSVHTLITTPVVLGYITLNTHVPQYPVGKTVIARRIGVVYNQGQRYRGSRYVIYMQRRVNIAALARIFSGIIPLFRKLRLVTFRSLLFVYGILIRIMAAIKDNSGFMSFLLILLFHWNQ